MMSEAIQTTAPAKETPVQLLRQIGLFDATMIVMGGIVGAGIFINPYVVARQVHTPILILAAWVAGGVVAMLGAFIYAELAARMPDVGGQYAYLRQAFHPVAGFLYGWVLLLVIQTGGMAAVTVTFARYLLELTGWPVSERLVAVATIVLLTVINCLGVRAGSRVQSILMLLKIGAIATLVLAGLFLIRSPYPLLHPVLDRAPSLDLVTAIGAAMVPVLFAFGGWQTANFIATEIKDPQRNLSRALVMGVTGVIVLYLGVNFVCVRALGAEGLAASTVPASAVMHMALGNTGARLIALGIAVSTLGFLSQSILTAPRVYFAMASDGLFFKAVARVNKKSHVPVLAIVMQSVLTLVIALVRQLREDPELCRLNGFHFLRPDWREPVRLPSQRSQVFLGGHGRGELSSTGPPLYDRTICRHLLVGRGQHDLQVPGELAVRNGNSRAWRSGVRLLGAPFG